MIYLQIEDLRVRLEPSQLTLTTRLNGIDNLVVTLSGDEEYSASDILNYLLADKNIQLFEDDYLIFTGYIEDPELNISSRDTLTFTVISKLARLKRISIPLGFSLENQNVVDFLNANSFGIKFVSNTDINEDSYTLKTPTFTTAKELKSGITNLFNTKSRSFFLAPVFSKKITELSWFNLLVSLSKETGFYFWYDYALDACVIGVPNQIIKLVDADLTEGVFSIQQGLKIDKTELANRIVIFGGGIDKIGLENTSTELQNELGYAVQQGISSFGNLTYYYIEDAESIAKYGLYEYNMDSIDIISQNTSLSAKAEASNGLYRYAVAEIQAKKDPIIQIRDATYYIKKYSERDLKQNTVLDLDFHLVPGDENSYRIQDQFLITDISSEFNNLTTEGYYTLTLANNLNKTDKVNEIYQNLRNLMKNRGIAVSNQSIFTDTVVANNTTSSVTFSLDTKYKRIRKYEIFLKVNGSSTTDSLTIGQITIDGLDITSLFPNNIINIVGTATVKVPKAGTVDVITLPNPNRNLLNAVLNNTSQNLHTLTFGNVTGTGSGNIDITIFIEGEI